MALGVIGIPKTIDNDVSFVQKTFGFGTAVPEARRAIYAANTEAEAAPNGIGLVKLIGRDSGFIGLFGPGRQPGKLFSCSRLGLLSASCAWRCTRCR
jgi:6-phosphofructokinase